MTVELAVNIATRHHPQPVVRAEYRDNNTWKLVNLKRPKKVHPVAWKAFTSIAKINFYQAKTNALMLSLEWNLYPLHPDKALAVHIGNTIERGTVVKPMDEDLLYVLT